MREKFGGDIVFVSPSPKRQASNIAYADPRIELTPEGFYRDIWGVDFRLVEHSTGVYVDLARHPLKNISSLEDLENYPYWPSADFWDYSTPKSQCLANARYATLGHSRGFFEISWFLRGMDNFLSDSLLNPSLACGVIDKVLEYLSDRMERILRSVEGNLTMFELNDDVGGQNALLISPDVWRKYIKPRLKKTG